MKPFQQRAVEFVQEIEAGATFSYEDLPKAQRKEVFEYLAAAGIVELACI